jgi:hypothetical protein
MAVMARVWEYVETERVRDLRRRVRAAMETAPIEWACPQCLPAAEMDAPLPVRKARALALKLSLMPADLWDGQLLAGSMTLEAPHVHYEHGFPDYATFEEKATAAAEGLSIRSVFGPSCRFTRACCAVVYAASWPRPRPSGPPRPSRKGRFLESVAVALQGEMA